MVDRKANFFQIKFEPKKNKVRRIGLSGFGLIRAKNERELKRKLKKVRLRPLKGSLLKTHKVQARPVFFRTKLRLVETAEQEQFKEIKE